MLGSWGDIIFNVSADKVITFDGFSRSVSANIGEHSVGGHQAIIEWIAPGSDTISFDLSLRADLNVNPRQIFDKISDYCKNGSRFPLIIGQETIGGAGSVYICESCSEERIYVDGQGNLLQSRVSVSLKLAPSPSASAARSGMLPKNGIRRIKVA